MMMMMYYITLAWTDSQGLFLLLFIVPLDGWSESLGLTFNIGKTGETIFTRKFKQMGILNHGHVHA